MTSEVLQQQSGYWYRLWVFACRFVLIMLLWLVISEFDGQLLLYGLLTAIVIALVSLRLLPPQNRTVSVIGVARFIPYFIWRSVLGGLDVAWRACHPRLPISPCMIEYRLSIRSEIEKTLLLLIVSLLPGTLSVRIQDEVLKVHCLDADVDHAIAIHDLERRIAMMFRHESLTGAG